MRKKRTLVKKSEPQVIVGSHLTVTVHPNGYRELKWDDAALARDVKQAITQWETAHQQPDLTKMTKKQLEDYGIEKYNINLDRRLTKNNMIKQLHDHVQAMQ